MDEPTLEESILALRRRLSVVEDILRTGGALPALPPLRTGLQSDLLARRRASVEAEALKTRIRHVRRLAKLRQDFLDLRTLRTLSGASAAAGE